MSKNRLDICIKIGVLSHFRLILRVVVLCAVGDDDKSSSCRQEHVFLTARRLKPSDIARQG